MRRVNREGRIVRAGVGTLSLILAFIMNGCQSAQPREPAISAAEAEAWERANEARAIADATLGKQSEILAQGDLAQNGREQLLVVNRFRKDALDGVSGSSAIFITQAAVLEKNGDKWAEVLLCDEHLKNPNGYLGGVPWERVAGWRIELSQDAARGLEMSFTPADEAGIENVPSGRVRAQHSVIVRWNKAAKRYQSFDRPHGRYLPDLPALEAQPSTLK